LKERNHASEGNWLAPIAGAREKAEWMRMFERIYRHSIIIGTLFFQCYAPLLGRHPERQGIFFSQGRAYGGCAEDSFVQSKIDVWWIRAQRNSHVKGRIYRASR